jgi:MFS family permease
MLSPLLRRRDFRTFWLGQTASLFGDEITLFAIPITAVLLLHAGPAAMGVLTAAGLLPSLLLSLHAGAWVDRSGRRRRAMLICDIARAVLLLSVPLAWALSALHVAQLYTVAIVIGVFDVFFAVAYQSLFASMTPPEDYVAGQALLNGSRAAAFVGGTGIAGLLVTVFSAPGALVVDAATFLFSACTLRAVRTTEAPPSAPDDSDVRTGLRWIRHSLIVRAALAATATVNLFTFMFSAIFVLYATRSLHVHPGVLGTVLAAGGVGSLLGSLVTGRIARRIGTGRTFAIGMVLFPAPLVLVPLADGSRSAVLVMLFLAEFGSGFGVMMLDIGAGALFAETIPGDLRARVAGAYRMINYGIRPVGALLGGGLGSWLGLRPTLWIAVIGATISVLPLIGSPVLARRSAPVAA